MDEFYPLSMSQSVSPYAVSPRHTAGGQKKTFFFIEKLPNQIMSPSLLQSAAICSCLQCYCIITVNNLYTLTAHMLQLKSEIQPPSGFFNFNSQLKRRWANRGGKREKVCMSRAEKWKKSLWYINLILYINTNTGLCEPEDQTLLLHIAKLILKLLHYFLYYISWQ